LGETWPNLEGGEGADVQASGHVLREGGVPHGQRFVPI